MALNKRQYVDGQTIVTAANLNEIQDCIIAIEGAYVPKTRKVAGKALSSDITISASDVGAVPTSRTINAKALTGNITLSAADVGAVPVARTVNGKALSSNITLSAADVSAVPTTRTVNSKALSQDISLTASDVGAVPTGRTVNGKALSSDITLEASDVGAVPTSRTVNGKALSASVTLASSDIGDDSDAGGTDVKASLSLLKGSVDGKLSLYSMLTESPNGIPTDSEIISSIALHEGGSEFAVRFHLSNGRSVYTIIWVKLLETLASGLGFGFYEDSGYTLRRYHYNSPNLNTFNYHGNVISAQNTAIKALNDIATYENGTTASRNYSVGQYLIYDGYLYRVISAISSGATFSPGTNITRTNIGDNINIMDVSLNLSSLPSNVTDRGCFCKRFGKLIFLSIDVAVTGTSSTPLNNLLPVGCRPKTNVNVVMADGTGNGYVTVLVNGYGSVIMYPKGSGYCQGNLTFIAE